MNYDETAKKILSDWDNYCFKLLDGDTPAFDIQEAIAAALRRAANEAAWRVWGECEKNVIALVEAHGGSCDVNPGAYMLEYGPRPEGGAR